MKTALSLAAVLALGCASAALAQSDRYASPYDQGGQYGQTQNPSDQYGPQNDEYQNNQNPYDPDSQTNPGYRNEPGGQYDQNQYDRGQYDQNSGAYGSQMNGMDRDEVRRLQLRLRHEGYDPGTADGNWGQQTASALADFQRANGIEPTGNLDRRTARALGLPPDQGYGGEGGNVQPDNGQPDNGQYGNDYNNPDMDNNSPQSNNPDENDQSYPH